MIRDMRTKLATGLMTGVLSLIPFAHAAAAPGPRPTRYVCEPQQYLVVERDRSIAHVHFIDRSYELRRARSSIGVKYVSGTAALIIDGPSAVFVADDRLQLGTCAEAVRIATG